MTDTVLADVDVVASVPLVHDVAALPNDTLALHVSWSE